MVTADDGPVSLKKIKKKLNFLKFDPVLSYPFSLMEIASPSVVACKCPWNVFLISVAMLWTNWFLIGFLDPLPPTWFSVKLTWIRPTFRLVRLTISAPDFEYNKFYLWMAQESLPSSTDRCAVNWLKVRQAEHLNKKKTVLRAHLTNPSKTRHSTDITSDDHRLIAVLQLYQRRNGKFVWFKVIHHRIIKAFTACNQKC